MLCRNIPISLLLAVDYLIPFYDLNFSISKILAGIDHSFGFATDIKPGTTFT